MIQRIQSVYLFLAGLSLIAAALLPFAEYQGTCDEPAVMNALSLCTPGIECQSTHLPYLACLGFVNAVIAFVGIFLYKNRKRQIKALNNLLILILLFCIFAVVLAITMRPENYSGPAPTYGCIFPVLGYTFTWLARRGVRKDEELVRAAERFR